MVPEKIKLSRSIALTLTHRRCNNRDNSEGAGKDDLRRVLRGYQATRLSLDRDEMEHRMFACKLLLMNHEAWGLDRFETTEYCDQLLGLCRRATRPGRLNSATDVDFLRYLRGYYDAVFVTKVAQKPTPVKELIEIAWEATRGRPYAKSKVVEPSLVLYQARGQFHLLLDMPASPESAGFTKYCRLQQEWNDETLVRDACGDGPLLPVPGEIRQALVLLNHSKRIALRWRDPITGIGIRRSVSQRTTEGAELLPVSGNSGGPDSLRFPFGLETLMDRTSFSDLADLEEFWTGQKLSAAVASKTVKPPSVATPSR